MARDAVREMQQVAVAEDEPAKAGVKEENEGKTFERGARLITNCESAHESAALAAPRPLARTGTDDRA